MPRSLACFASLALFALGCGGSGGVIVGTGTTANGSGSGSGATNGGATHGAGAGAGTSGSTGTTGTATTEGTSNGGSTGTPCSNLQCLVQQCPNGKHTTISGTIMDPAGSDPLYNVVAYVPNSDVQPLPSGASCATCNSLFSGEPMADGLSDPSGHFTIMDAPVSPNVPVVIQVGKWRTHTTVPNVVACQDNPIGAVKFPSKMDPADGIINLPDIAISTGGADSLECLLVRVGIDSSEYVPGTSTAGKVHIFNGGSGGGGGESNQMSGAPESDQSLWNSGTSMQPYDIVLLSCEGDETYDAMPANLETYLNTQGGRVFASHFHYAWFTGATEGQTPSYTAPADWGSGGSDLANWSPGGGAGDNTQADGNVVTTLWNGTGFPKGEALATWLGNVNALGTSGASPTQLYIAAPRENATVVQTDANSQPWITDAATGSTLYFSFNTPLGANPLSEGTVCQGRAVFSGLHVGGASLDTVNGGGFFGGGSPPPAGCDTTQGLSPQEKALEFMLFDLSSCVVPDTADPADAGSGPILR